MTWPQAFALVGVAASLAAMAWALAWMTVRTESEPTLRDPDKWEIRKEARK